MRRGTVKRAIEHLKFQAGRIENRLVTEKRNLQLSAKKVAEEEERLSDVLKAIEHLEGIG